MNNTNTSLLSTDLIDFTKEPLFFGSGRNIARLDLNIEQWTQNQTDKALGRTWFKHDFSYINDGKDFASMSPELQDMFLFNLKFQTLLDSLATRTVLEVFKPCTTNPQLESWWTVHGFQEDIHSQSYAELIKALPINATKVFDDIMINPKILTRAESILGCFDDTVVHNAMRTLNHPDYNFEDHKRSLILSLYALNILEAGLFQTSFITTFAFAENGLMESSGKTMSKISQDETGHKAMTQYLINRHKKDPEWKYLFVELEPQIIEMYQTAYEADHIWIDQQFEDGARLLGLNANVLKQFAQYNMFNAMAAIGLPQFVEKVKVNPCMWSVKYTNTSKTQVALNEADGINYLLGALNKDMTQADWDGMLL